MTSEILSGRLVTSGGRSLISGTLSGLSTEALVENAVQANNAQADRLDLRIEQNDLEIAAFEEFYGLANNLQTSLSALKSNTSQISDINNAFEQRTANLTSTDADATGLINISLDENAPEGTYQIVVEQKAEAFKTASTNVVDKDAALGYTGDFDIGLDGFSATNINVAAGDSLQDIADAINADSANSGVAASILKISETDYQLVLEGTQTNTAMSVTTNSGSVLQNLGVVDGADTFEAAQIIQNEQGSQITYNGTTITRDDNAYDDLIDGVSIDIKAADSDSTITIDVNNDASNAKEQILAFIESYNAFREFVLTNQAVNADGSIPEDAVLFSENTVENLSNNVFSYLTSFKSNNGNVTNLGDLGIGFDEQNRLILDDETALDNALLSDFNDVKNFFTTNFETDNSALGLVTNLSTQESLSFDLNITVDGTGRVSSAFANGTALNVSGNNISGPEGSIYEGLTFAYIGGVNTTISVDITGGIADQIFNTTENYTNPVTGLIQSEIESRQSSNEDLAEEAEEIRARGEEIREREIEKYSDLEAALLRAQSLKSTLQALLGNNDDD